MYGNLSSFCTTEFTKDLERSLKSPELEGKLILEILQESLDK